MKMITSIIRRLETDQELTADEKGVVAYMLKEMMSRDKFDHDLVTAEMSPEMYKLFIHFAYTNNGTYKVELFEKT